jgi:membrane protease YdiL (CAAX protease family)
MTGIIVRIGLVIVIIISFILSGRWRWKTIGIWDIVFIAAFWNFFDTGWWFFFDWTQQTEPDMLSTQYMISAVPFALIFLAYIKRRSIDLGPVFQTKLLIIPKPPSESRQYIALLAFTGIAVFIVVPIAYAMGFIAWTPDLRYFRMPVRFLEYFFLVGFVEELVFRGVIQNLLHKTFRFRYGGIAAFLLANLLFAFIWTHAGVPAPINWDYVILAFILGLFYGGVYIKSGNFWTAAFLHGLTDFLWVSFFAGQG